MHQQHPPSTLSLILMPVHIAGDVQPLRVLNPTPNPNPTTQSVAIPTPNPYLADNPTPNPIPKSPPASCPTIIPAPPRTYRNAVIAVMLPSPLSPSPPVTYELLLRPRAVVAIKTHHMLHHMLVFPTPHLCLPTLLSPPLLKPVLLPWTLIFVSMAHISAGIFIHCMILFIK